MSTLIDTLSQYSNKYFIIINIYLIIYLIIKLAKVVKSQMLCHIFGLHMHSKTNQPLQNSFTATPTGGHGWCHPSKLCFCTQATCLIRLMWTWPSLVSQRDLPALPRHFSHIRLALANARVMQPYLWESSHYTIAMQMIFVPRVSFDI